jgi:hypothetical protein
VRGTTPAAAAVEFVGAPGTTERNIVSYGFNVKADSEAAAVNGAAAALAAELDAPFTADDITVTAVETPPGSGIWAVSAKLDAGADAAAAQRASSALSSLTTAQLETVLGAAAGSVRGTTPATVATEYVAGSVTEGTINSPELVVGESRQSSSEDEFPIAVVIVIIVLFVIFLLLPLMFVLYARSTYGPGKATALLSYKCSHSNPSVPFCYVPVDQREKKRMKLMEKPKPYDAWSAQEEGSTSEAIHAGLAASNVGKASTPLAYPDPHESDAEKEMRMYFEQHPEALSPPRGGGKV